MIMGGGGELRYGERSFAGKPMTTALCREVQLLPQARVSENLTSMKYEDERRTEALKTRC